MKINQHFIIDFDSTFTRVEALDILAEISLRENEDKDNTIQQIKQLTDDGMGGNISFRESLKGRIQLLEANKSHLPELIARLSEQVSDSFRRNSEFISKYRDFIYIVSNGFKEFIVPIAEHYNIKAEHIYANEFMYGDRDSIVGFVESNLMSENNGKSRQIENLKLDGEVFVLGDGYTDYEIKKSGLANKFYVFTENVRRESVMQHADHEAPSLDEFLYDQNLKRALSYPKNRIKALLLENIHPMGLDMMTSEGYQIESFPAGMNEDELCEAIRNVNILGIRSKTRLTAKVLKNAKKLLTVGTFCIGTNQIDLTKCMEKGVVVFNAPFSNTRSVVELALAEIILLIRNATDKIRGMHQGNWQKSAAGSREVRGKTLGIIGYGNIGSQLSVLAESAGMIVKYYDVEEKLALGNAVQCRSFQEVLSTSDIISLHVDGRPENKHIIDDEEFGLMKEGVIFLNLSRGHVVNIDALSKYIKLGKIYGTGIDVFPEEPLSNDYPFDSPLRGLPNTILTPHLGGSTIEAQQNIANFVSEKIISYINSGSTANSVNFPNITLPPLNKAHRFIHIHKNESGILAKINKILALHGINIVSQYLKTNEVVGYVITDIDKDYDDEVIKDLKLIENTIRFRVLY